MSSRRRRLDWARVSWGLQTVVDSCTEDRMKTQRGKRKPEVERFTDKTVNSVAWMPLDQAHRSSLNLVTHVYLLSLYSCPVHMVLSLREKETLLRKAFNGPFQKPWESHTPTVGIFSDNSLRSLCLSWVRTDLLIGPPFHPNTALKTTLNTFLN